MLRIFGKMFPPARRESAAVQRALRQVITHQTSDGYRRPHVPFFERAIAKELGIAHERVIAVSSGTDAIFLSLKVLGIGPGDEVIVPAFGFIAGASAVLLTGATPIFVDVRSDDYALNTSEVRSHISRRTRAIILVHLFGQPALATAEIQAVAHERQLYLIEDVAQSFGAKIKFQNTWVSVGTLGDIGCFSFSSTKPLSALGNAGTIVVKERKIGERLRSMRSYGARRHYYDYPEVGMNCMMDDLQAAVLLAKIPFHSYWQNHRIALAAYYTKRLQNLVPLTLPSNFAETKRVFYRYVIRTSRRDQLFDRLRQVIKDWPLVKNYPIPLPYFLIFSKLGYRQGNFPISEGLCLSTISLPIAHSMGITTARGICDEVEQFFLPA